MVLDNGRLGCEIEFSYFPMPDTRSHSSFRWIEPGHGDVGTPGSFSANRLHASHSLCAILNIFFHHGLFNILPSFQRCDPPVSPWLLFCTLLTQFGSLCGPADCLSIHHSGVPLHFSLHSSRNEATSTDQYPNKNSGPFFQNKHL